MLLVAQGEFNYDRLVDFELITLGMPDNLISVRFEFLIVVEFS